MPKVYLLLLIPLIVTGIFYYFNKREFVWWEFFAPFIVTLIAIVVSKIIIDHTSVQFNEYWGSSVVSIYEEEPYNYWHHETCSYTTTDGKGNSTTHYYDCSHQDNVGPSWYGKTNIGEKIDLSEKEYDELVIRFGTDREIVGQHQNNDPDDDCVDSKGTKFEGKKVGNVSYVYITKWNGTDKTRKSYVSKHRYENRIKSSELTIFNIKLVTKETADSLGLFEYPEYKHGLFQKSCGLEYPTILGGSVSKEIQEKYRNLNGKFGPTNQLRLWILVFENKPMEIAYYQENYWVKGNKNELVICIGKSGNKIQWSHAFSWSLSDVLTTEVKNKVLDLYTYKDSTIKVQIPPVLSLDKNSKKKIIGKIGEKIPTLPISNNVIMTKDSTITIKSSYPVLNEKTWNIYYDFLNNNLHKFERRNFEEFNYITVEPSTGAIIFIFILSLLISIGVNIWAIRNDIKNNE